MFCILMKKTIYIYSDCIYKQKWFNHSAPNPRDITSLIQFYIKGWHLIILQFQQRMIFHSVFMVWICIFIKEMLLKTSAFYFSCQTSWHHSLSYLVSASLWNHPPSSFFTSCWMAHPPTTTIPLTISFSSEPKHYTVQKVLKTWSCIFLTKGKGTLIKAKSSCIKGGKETD